jgi:hypothetical protein
MDWLHTPCTAFEGSRCIATGELKDVAPLAKAALDRSAGSNNPLPVLVFNDASSETIELDWRGSAQDFAARLGLPASPPASSEPARGPGRPKLGVVAREVTLLPRHWEWLGQQPGGASVALRKLVEAARLSSEGKDRARQSREVGYKFMSTMAGHETGFEEASRDLFACDQAGLEARIAAWPVDVQTHLKKLLTEAFPA